MATFKETITSISQKIRDEVSQHDNLDATKSMDVLVESFKRNIAPINPTETAVPNPLEDVLNGALAVSSTLGVQIDLIELQKFHRRIETEKPTIEQMFEMYMDSNIFQMSEAMKKDGASFLKRLYCSSEESPAEEAPAEETPAEETPAEDASN